MIINWAWGEIDILFGGCDFPGFLFWWFWEFVFHSSKKIYISEKSQNSYLKNTSKNAGFIKWVTFILKKPAKYQEKSQQFSRDGIMPIIPVAWGLL